MKPSSREGSELDSHILSPPEPVGTRIEPGVVQSNDKSSENWWSEHSRIVAEQIRGRIVMRTNSSAVINLCFHGVGAPHRQLEEGEEPYWITKDSFIGILDLVADRNDVSLSFDDGNQSDIEIGLPALVERGLAAEFFPIASRLDCPGSLGGDDLRGLVAGGMSVGTHGMHHQSWRGIRGRDLEEELDAARSVLAAAIGRDVRTAACPLGAYDRRLLGELRKRGYVRVLTSDRALANPDSWLQPRFSVRAADDLQSIRLLLTCRPSALARARTRARILAKRWR